MNDISFIQALALIFSIFLGIAVVYAILLYLIVSNMMKRKPYDERRKNRSLKGDAH